MKLRLQPPPGHRALIAIAALLTLAACGGGGSDAPSPSDSQPAPVAAVESPAGEFVVNPQASWKPATSADPRRRENIASLQLNQLSSTPLAGRTLSAKALGSFAYGSTAGQTTPDASILFVDASGKALSPGAGTTAPAATKPISCETTDTSDPFAGDVLVGATAVNLVVPAGATAIWLSVDDCHYADNSQTSDPLRVKFTVR